MSLKQRLKHEIKTLVLSSLYFGSWIAALLALKTLMLAEYEIRFNKWSAAVVGALVLAKVVLVLEHVPVGGGWVRARPAWVDVVLRTALYSFGVLIVLAVERGISGWHEYGSFFASLKAALRGTNGHHVWVNSLCISGALLGYNVLGVVRRQLGDGALLRLFLTPLPPRDKLAIPSLSSTTPVAESARRSKRGNAQP